MNNNNYAVIMAGGIGSRFWPMSRSSYPKQFLDILGTGETLIQQTFKRLSKSCPIENILVVTNIKQTISSARQYFIKRLILLVDILIF